MKKPLVRLIRQFRIGEGEEAEEISEYFDFPTPSKYESTTGTLVDEARNTEGVFAGSVVRPRVARIDIEWNWLDVHVWASILKEFSDGKEDFVRTVEFFAQDYGDWVIRQMMVGNRSSSFPDRPLGPTGAPDGLVKCRFPLVEA